MILLVSLAAGALALGLVVVFGASAVERRLMYHPDPVRTAPESEGLSGVSELEIETGDGDRVLAWYAPAPAGAPTILYFHGNGGSLATRSERIGKYQARGYGIFMMSYRSYSGSTGTPSERANVADAKRAYDRLRALGVPPEQIIIYGESIGTGVAVQVAAERPARALILDSPYTSMLELAELHYPELPSRWLLTDRYESRDYIGRVHMPLLILHGGDDEIVPASMGKEMYELANQPKQLEIFPGVGHIDHWRAGSYDVLYAWLAALPALARAR